MVMQRKLGFRLEEDDNILNEENEALHLSIGYQD